MEIHGSESIVNSFREYCEHMGVHSSIGEQETKNSKIYVCRVNGYERSKVILDNLYSECNLKLSRKYQIYLDRYVNGIY